MEVLSHCDMNSADAGLLLTLPPRGVAAAGMPVQALAAHAAAPQGPAALQVPSPRQGAGAGGFKDLESPMAAYFGEVCWNQANAGSRPATPTHLEEGRSKSRPLDGISNSFLHSPASPNIDSSICSSTASKQLVGQSPCEAYFNGAVSFCLDHSPQESAADYAQLHPPHFQLSGAVSFPQAWSLAQHNLSYPFPLPTLLLPSQPPASQKRFCRPSKPASRSRGRAESTRTNADHMPVPPSLPIKRGFTAPVKRHCETVDTPACPKPSSAAGFSVAGHVWSLSQDSTGCREVQDAIDAAQGEPARLGLAMELSGHVWEALQCPHANHVVRKFVTTMSAHSLQFLIDELVHMGADVVREAARHRYGCRIVEALLKTCAVEQVSQMVEHLLPDVADLSVRMYGNFVVQRILEHGTDSQRNYINPVLARNVAAIASNFYGSAVVGAALKHCAEEDCVSLARAIIEVSGLFCAIIRFRHGNTIKDQVLEVLGASDQELAELAQKERPNLHRTKSLQSPGDCPTSFHRACHEKQPRSVAVSLPPS